MEVVVRDVLIATKGEFSAGVVRDCVSRMFDNAQKYDNTEAVVKQLKIEVKILENVFLHMLCFLCCAERRCNA